MRRAIPLDLVKPLDKAAVTLRQGEMGSTELYFVVTEDGEPINLSEYDEVVFRGAYEGGNVAEPVEIDELGNGLLVVPASMTKEPGRYTLAYLKLYDNDIYLVSSQSIDIEVLPAVRG